MGTSFLLISPTGVTAPVSDVRICGSKLKHFSYFLYPCLCISITHNMDLGPHNCLCISSVSCHSHYQAFLTVNILYLEYDNCILFSSGSNLVFLLLPG